MEEKHKIATFLVFLLIAVIIFYFVGNDVTPQTQFSNDEPQVLIDEPTDDLIYIASWNIQIFGDSKVSEPGMLGAIIDKIDDYDIIFIQEIRDADGSSFELLCANMTDFNCEISSRAGRSTSKEQIGLIYRKNQQMIDFVDYNPDEFDRWERPPIKVSFFKNGYIFHIWNIHIKPDDAVNEIQNLQTVVKNEGNVLITGDLNADCNYYDPLKQQEFVNWKWLIGDEVDTTVGDTNCAYDRILANTNIYNEIVGYGVDTRITASESDHYLVWTSLEPI